MASPIAQVSEEQAYIAAHDKVKVLIEKKEGNEYEVALIIGEQQALLTRSTVTLDEGDVLNFVFTLDLPAEFSGMYTGNKKSGLEKIRKIFIDKEQSND